MMLHELIPAFRWVIVGICGVGLAVTLWGFISPRTQWPLLLWGWQHRFRHVPPAERDSYVRRLSVVPTVAFIVVGLVFLVFGR